VTAGVIACLAAIRIWNQNGHAVKAFVASSGFLFFMLAGACWGLYPTLLPASTSSSLDITLDRAISGPHTLAVGLVWWLFGMTLAVSYVVFVYTRFKGKADLSH
jgi:cytochrome d ubiquinol oxidase subunit II